MCLFLEIALAVSQVNQQVLPTGPYSEEVEKGKSHVGVEGSNFDSAIDRTRRKYCVHEGISPHAHLPHTHARCLPHNT